MTRSQRNSGQVEWQRGNSAPPLGETARAIISIFLFIHVFLLVVCFSANLAPSSIQQRLLGVFQPYTQLLNLDPDGTRLFLTHASVRDVDHRIEVLPKGKDSASSDSNWESISRGMRGGERRHRYQHLADALAFFQEDEETTALIAEGVARNHMDINGQTIARIRCRQHTLQSPESINSDVPSGRDPDSSNYFSTVYQADVLTPAPNQIRILKRTKASLEAAPKKRGAAGKIGATPKPE